MTSPEQLQSMLQMGECEVCGAQATHHVFDYVEVFDDGAGSYWPAKQVLSSGSHRFCEMHYRPSKRTQVVDDIGR